MKKIMLLIVSGWMVFTSCADRAGQDKAMSMPDKSAAMEVKGQSSVKDELSAQNVLQVALGSEDHTTLVAAVQAAGLEDVLVNAGPLTVFAPVNDAFSALPEGVLDDLLKPENKSKLARIIKYHASPGNNTIALLKDGMNLYQASGHYVKVEQNGDTFDVGGARIIASVPASNGIVHVIDKVLLPPEG
jgi:uncharacterized surface protein with fasciclin (FAS1) repeats